MFALAIAVAVVCLGTLPTFRQVVAAFATVEASKDGDPQGLLPASLALEVGFGGSVGLCACPVFQQHDLRDYDVI